jgi:enediyne biosynthesis protein E4
VKKNLLLYIVSFITILLSCKNDQSEKKTALFQLMEKTGIGFVNTVQDNDSINILNYRNFYNGGGVAIGDINNDGLADIFFTANQGSNKLYLNKGDFKFEDISAKAGFANKKQFSTGVVMADINHDGWLDIYVCNAGNMHDPELRKNQLFINNHNLVFTDSAEQYGLADDGYSTQASFFDYDLDGDLDCFIINNSPIPVNSLNYPQLRDVPAKDWQVPDYLKGGGDHLYRNDNGHFNEVTQQAGIHGTLMSFGLGVTIGDVNGDNYPDVYVSNDFFERDYLYINQKNGTFKDELENWVQHSSYASMGADFGDINNDGYPEIFTTDMLPADDYRLKTTLSFDDIDLYRLKEKNGFYHQFLQNTLQLNNRNGKFMDIAHYSGVSASEWSWGGLMLDADNDGLIDLYVCNGIYRDLTNQDFLDFDANDIKEKMIATGKKDLMELVNKIPSIAVPNKMFRNLGNLKFADEGESWGMTQNSFSNGAAYADLDNDGDLDMVVNNVNEPAFIFKNYSREQNHYNYIGISLKGKNENDFAIGSKILVYKDKEILSREVIPSRGFQSSMDYKQIIGIGTATDVDSMTIIWPDLTVTRINHPGINKVHSLLQPESGPKATSIIVSNQDPLFITKKSNFEKHQENDYIDFYQERAIPEMLSCEGPKAATGDVNADGLDDIYISGTSQHSGQLYIQLANGEFIKKEEPAFNSFSTFEDAAVLMFDCDNDSDLDLFISGGGNEAMPSSRELQHRLFINDGKGNFQLSGDAFPVNKDNIAAVASYDFDKDGDPDLFVGARCVSKQYGVTPLSHIYINNGKGIFSDMPADKMQGIDNAGLVTGAVWADLDGDKEKELVIAGEWMAPRIFKFQQDHFVELPTNLSGKSGWWQTVAAKDLNADGKEDLVFGNFGDNFYLHPDDKNPVKIWMNDFDGNGVIDKIISRTIEGKDKPVFMKRDVQDGLPVLKKQNLRHAVYAKKAIQELFTNEQLKKAEVKEVNYSSSCIAFSKGNGNFEIQPLPVVVQLSSVRAVAFADVNDDGNTDLVLGGNEFNFQPQLGRLDASPGYVLLNDGKGNFTLADERESGLGLNGMVRNIAVIKEKKGNCLLFLQNNEYPVLYRLKKKESAKKKD